jgi:hypothetical protein
MAINGEMAAIFSNGVMAVIENGRIMVAAQSMAYMSVAIS